MNFKIKLLATSLTTGLLAATVMTFSAPGLALAATGTTASASITAPKAKAVRNLRSQRYARRAACRKQAATGLTVEQNKVFMYQCLQGK